MKAITAIFLALLLFGCAEKKEGNQMPEDILEDAIVDTPVYVENELGSEYNKSFAPRTVIPGYIDIDKIASDFVEGGPEIQTLENSSYVLAVGADEFLKSDDIVFGVEYSDLVVAYPEKIMNWHEIVNEKVEGEKLSITYCPLTGSAIGFKGRNLEVSRYIYNSNLVMFDNETGSYWPQILGASVDGKLKGEILETFPIRKTTWGRWRRKHPDTRVLSIDTGYDLDYDLDPYAEYGDMTRLYFPVAERSELFPEKKLVVGVRIDDLALAIPESEFKDEMFYELGEHQLYIAYDSELDAVRVYEEDTELDAFEIYWFAWYGYFPETAVLEV